MTILQVIPKAGRSYGVDANGPTKVSQRFQLVLDAPLPPLEAPSSFPGVPAIGSAHPSRLGFYATNYEVSQPDGAAKNTLMVEVIYNPSSITVTPPTETEPGETVVIGEWGWDDSMGERDLVSTAEANPRAVVNSAGDPFDRAPSVSIPTPMFTKVLRASARKPYAQYLCCTNAARLTIGDMVCEPGTLLCSVAERKIIGEALLPYEYTVHLRYRSNIVISYAAGGVATEIGWDVAVVDAGMRELDNDTGLPKLIQVVSEETGQVASVTSPELLDGSGHAIVRGSGAAQPVVLVFPAYKRVQLPEWMYSEPPTPAPAPDNGD